MAETTEKITVREAVFFMKNFNCCIEEIVKNVDNVPFKNILLMGVCYPLRKLLNDWDEWYDMEKGISFLNKEIKTF